MSISAKELILELIRIDIKREGVGDLVQFLESSDFWTAPASSKFHGINKGDLALHSLEVRNKLEQKVEEYKLPYSKETITICGLFHDACKIHFYKEKKQEPATKSQLDYFRSLRPDFVLPSVPQKAYLSVIIDKAKNGGILEEVPVDGIQWEVADQFPFGHGEKSVAVLSKYIQLTDEEACAIRFHMGPWEPGVLFPPLSYSYRNAIEKFPLVPLLSISDYEVSTFLKI